MRSISPAILSLALVLVACKPAQPRLPASTKTDTPSVAIEPGGVSPSSESSPAAAPAPSRVTSEPEARQPAKNAERPKPKSVDSTSKRVAAPRQLPKLWDFGAERCIPCKTMASILNPMMQEFAGRVEIRMIDVYSEQALASKYRIMIIPTQVFMDTLGRELWRHVGVLSRDSILLKFREFGFVAKR